MKKLILVLSSLVFLSSCASVNIKPIKKDLAKNVHTKDSNLNLNGYILYAPKVLIQIKQVKGECKISTVSIPDKTKPFLLDIQSGFGKSDINVKIINGWMLGDIKANIDNTAVLDKITSFSNEIDGGIPAVSCNPSEGLYDYNISDTGEITLSNPI